MQICRSGSSEANTRRVATPHMHGSASCKTKRAAQDTPDALILDAGKGVEMGREEGLENSRQARHGVDELGVEHLRCRCKL